MAAPLLETPRLILRLMRADDVTPLLSVFADPKVMAAFDSPPFDHAQVTRWVQRNLDHQAAHGFGLFSIIRKDTGLLIGDCGLELMEVDGTEVAELGYDICSDHWHQGYATEAAGAVRDYALNHLHLPVLISLIRIGNSASKRVAEKIGMNSVGEINRDGIEYWQYRLTRTSADV